MKKEQFTKENYVVMATQRLNDGAWRRALHYLKKAEELEAQRQAEAEAKAQAKASLLSRLGITADEAKLLLEGN